MPEGRPISRRHFLKLIGYLGLVSLGGFGGFLEVYKKGGSFLPSVSRLQTASAQTGGGSWSLGPDTTFVVIHAAITYTGKIFYFAGSGYDINNEHGPYNAGLRDPSTGSDSAVSISEDLFCAHNVQLPDGKILICGGTLLYDTDVNNCNGQWHGLNAAYSFDPSSVSLVKLASMSHGRWYPTLVTLPDGKIVCVSGFDEYGANNNLVEVYDSSSNTWSIKYDPSTSNTYCVGSGMTNCPGAGSPCYGGPNQGVSPWLDIYPRMNLMPSGLVFRTGMGQTTMLWDPAIGTWTTVNITSQFRNYGTSILLPLQNTSSERGKVILVGGSTSSGLPTSVVEMEDFNAGSSTSPVKRTIPSINHARKWLLPIILPSGKIAIFGGTSGGSANTSIFIPEIFDPENETQGWTDLPAATVARKYHGIALLLPDGSVWTAGSAPDQTTHELRTEIFKPDYFSAPTRPTISGIPSVGAYGGSITIPTPDAANITRVSLVRLGSTTHHYDTDARLIWLQITSTASSSITVSAPLNANLAPPGYYMIHVLNSSGIPSVSKIIQIPGSAGGGDTTPPSQVTGLTVTTPSGTSAQLNLAWNANTEPDLNHYNVYRGTTAGFTVNTSTDTPIVQPTKLTNSYTDSGLTASTTYYYKLAAVDNAGNIGALSAEASGTTGAAASPYHYAPYLTLTGTSHNDVPSTSSLQLTQFSVASWFQTSKVYSTIACIVNKGGFGSETAGQNMNYGIWVNATNKLQAGFETSTGTDNNVTAPSTNSDGQWHYAVVTYDGAVLNLYVDNIKVATKSTSGAVPDNTGTQPVRVGANSLSLNYFFTGNVDEVRVWNRALTASEIANQYNSGIFDTTGQVLYLPFS